MDLINRGLNGEIEETPKAGDPIFEKTFNLIIGSNILALTAAEQKAKELGYNTLILSSAIEGETKEVAKVHTAIAKEIRATGNPTKKPACIISGGETTVTITGTGLGGRNQEFVLASALQIAGMSDTVVFSGGTDGTDGPTDAAGAIADGFTFILIKTHKRMIIRLIEELHLAARCKLPEIRHYILAKRVSSALLGKHSCKAVGNFKIIMFVYQL
ncbi:MAG TPA: MOFRL family protein [Desulfobacteria bacterium]|nr:MOFRL family protein [Desulfobacteria bacterium]